MRKYSRVLRVVTEHPWAILPERLDALLDAIQAHLDAGGPLTPEAIEARIGPPRSAPEPRQEGAVAVIPIQGVLAHRMNLMTAMSGGTSTDVLSRSIQIARADPEISAILLDVDSPGGSVFGIQELADEIFSARGPKPILAVANATAASAAYWLASQADQFLVTPSGMVGSIGVIATHVDRSKQAEMLGVRQTIVSAGKYKAEANDMAPLDPEARDDIQRKVDEYYAAFVKAVARGRGVPVAEVRGGMGQGRMLTAKDAVTERMVDGVATLDQALGSLLAGRKRVPGLGAEEESAAAFDMDEVADFRRRLEALA